MTSYDDFSVAASPELIEGLEFISRKLQDELKVYGDWKIYPYAVHDLVAKGRVTIEERCVYVDGQVLPEYGLRL